jgi:hypothetical protein
MSTTVTCPRCSKNLKIPEVMLGHKFTCSRCGHTFNFDGSPAEIEQRDRDDDYYDRPRRRRRRSPSKSAPTSPLPWILAGGAVLLVIVVACGGGAFYIWKKNKPETNPNVSQANFEKLQTGMTISQVEAILGKGKEPLPREFDKLLENEEEKHQDMLDAFENAYDDECLIRWRNGDAGIWIIFTQNPKSGGKIQYAAFVTQNGAKMQVVSKGKLPELPKN